jgi:protein tyrosine phosphatase
MVLEKNVQNIVMINTESELTQNTCYKYFPDEKTPVVTGNYKIKMPSTPSEHGAYSVSAFEIVTTKKVKRTLKKNDIKDVEVLKVNHYWYKRWPDKRVISNEDNTCIELIHRIHHHHQSKSTLSNESPLLVHCSAGVGRTGTFIGLDIGIRLYHLNFTIDVENIVQFLRCNRNNYMVQTEKQYYYLYNTLQRYTLERNKKISPSKNKLNSTEKKLFKLTL